MEKMYKACVVCGKEYGPAWTEQCCTPTSLVATKRGGIFKNKIEYFSFDGKPLTQDALAEIRKIETAKAEQENSKRPIKQPSPSNAVTKSARSTAEGERRIKAALMRPGPGDFPAVIRPVEEVRTRWRWNGTRWIVAIVAYGILCAVGLLSPAAGPDMGMGTLLGGFGAIIIVVTSFLTDRSWSLAQRILCAVAILLLWSGWFTASLFLVTKIGRAAGLLPGSEQDFIYFAASEQGFNLYFDVVYQVSFAPFVLFALRRSRLFVTPKILTESGGTSMALS